jgi:hypothetical protein
MVYFMDVTVESRPMVVSNFNVPRSERKLLRPRRLVGAHSGRTRAPQPVFFTK